ncbi:DUF1634 domain-containing protein [Pediococcus argentinicus]|uniref:Membrane protein n=1 Tax=Pediococcus argentinicus TaxID=480391 RepID=A0A0R2ND12_9LACO|nr:DUF1634 domain-containing protein [Pediococcus argentinicus]KRO23752.1 membrane protein [Pediococcus argentinicus]NKZ22833.1 DUF1634 domain-containing protein [Pediococcus argentinicus]GEP19901.1 membrane protein [Pediococcus argentinicus]
MQKENEEMEKVELLIGRILQIGVIVSAIIIVLGIALWLIQGGSGYPHGIFPHRFGTVTSGVIAFKPYAVVMLGIFCLILTPVLRVVVSIYAFAKEHDQLYVWITTIVLVILLIGMYIGYLGK